MSRYGVVSVSFGLAGLFLLGGISQATGDAPDWHPLEVAGGTLAAGSGTSGDCDGYLERDSWMQGGSPQTVTLRIKFLVFGDDPDYAATMDDVNAQVDQLNDDFSAYRIQFSSGDTEFIDDNDYYEFCAEGTCFCTGECRPSCESEEKAMKTAYADDPDQQLNVYVVDLNTHTDYKGVGYFPWCSQPTGTLGGIIIDDEYFGGEGDCKDSQQQAADCHTLTHEIGHNLGLWHTHHGVSEVDECSDCYEPADTEPPYCNNIGDLCCDTPPTPKNYECDDPIANDDPCSDDEFADTDYTNYMGYGGDGCWTHFQPQQYRRLHCWMCSELGGWVSGESIAACCRDDDSCLDTTETCCDNAGGTFVSGASTCGSTGACCLGDGGCEDDIHEACCVDDGGSFVGSETSCDSGEEHACCLDGGSCIDTTEQCCEAWEGSYRPTKTCATLGIP